MWMDKQSIAWTRLAAEFIVIVVGVMVALAVDQWMDALGDRELEIEYADRLRDDLAADTFRFAEVEQLYELKISMLGELLEARETPPSVTDADGMLSRLDVSRITQMPEMRSETFREMESSGTLGLLRDVTLRGNLATYYARHELFSGVFAEPPGGYDGILTGALPGGLWYSLRIDSTRVDAGDLERGLRALMSHPDLESALNSELAYATSLLFYTRQSKTRANDLLALLAATYPE